MKPRIAFFDLDHTLLDGDSDVLWCDFLVARGVLERGAFAARNADIAARYQAGNVDPVEFANFYVSTLAGRSGGQWEPLRQEFMRDAITPRIPKASFELVRQHQAQGDIVVLTTATNRFITELTAIHLGIEHLIATECETGADQRFTGRIAGTLNMREGKVTRLHQWLAAQGHALDDCDSTLYSDSINDLPLLEAVRHAVAVNPDPRLAAQAAQRGWPVLNLHPST